MLTIFVKNKDFVLLHVYLTSLGKNVGKNVHFYLIFGKNKFLKHIFSFSAGNCTEAHFLNPVNPHN